MRDYTKLLTDGYYIGNISEIVSDQVEFQRMINRLKELSVDKSKMYWYRHVIRFHPEYVGGVEVKDIPARKALVDENGWSVGQQWYETVRTNENIDLFNYFQNIIVNFVPEIYPEVGPHNIRYNDQFTIYETGDFTGPHTDGTYDKNPGRLCVVLIYLSDEKDYNDGGGKFILEHNDQRIEVLPIKGTYVMLDFTNHNVAHEVEIVKNNFQRFCYINFVYNKEKENE